MPKEVHRWIKVGRKHFDKMEQVPGFAYIKPKNLESRRTSQTNWFAQKWAAGLPDGILSNQKSEFRYIFNALECDILVYFMDIWYF
jgi:hypothetical protein